MGLGPEACEASLLIIEQGEAALHRGLTIEGSSNEEISDQCRFKAISKNFSPDPLAVIETELKMGPGDGERPSSTLIKEDEVISTMINSMRFGQIVCQWSH